MQETPDLRNLEKSYSWLTLALLKVRGPKRKSALELRARVAASMTETQIVHAKKWAREWQAQER